MGESDPAVKLEVHSDIEASSQAGSMPTESKCDILRRLGIESLCKLVLVFVPDTDGPAVIEDNSHHTLGIDTVISDGVQIRGSWGRGTLEHVTLSAGSFNVEQQSGPPKMVTCRLDNVIPLFKMKREDEEQLPPNHPMFETGLERLPVFD